MEGILRELAEAVMRERDAEAVLLHQRHQLLQTAHNAKRRSAGRPATSRIASIASAVISWLKHDPEPPTKQRHHRGHSEQTANSARSGNIMHYLFLLYRDESVQLPFDIVQEQGAFSDDAREQGAYISGDGLDAIATAMTVRVRDDKVLVTDGPFVESKEVLGGFHILECDDIDAAIEYAAKNPTSKVGAVEIRPIMEF